MPTFGSLFAGIGGIDLGLERAGWTGRWQVEWDPFCQHVLAHHWPDVPRYGDITRVDWSTVEPVDLIAGGFPCQPFSAAGRQRGLEDERWLWPPFADAIRALRPRYVLVENVPGLLASDGGMDAVLGDLATLGYGATWDVVPAAAVGAPHLRERVWVVAYPDSESQPGFSFDGVTRQGLVVQDADRSAVESRWGRGRAPEADQPPTPDAAGIGPQEPGRLGFSSYREAGSDGQADHALDGRWWATEPDVGRVAHGVPARVDRLRALGNAVVPQVVEVIGRRLIEFDRENVYTIADARSDIEAGAA